MSKTQKKILPLEGRILEKIEALRALIPTSTMSEKGILYLQINLLKSLLDEGDSE